MKQTAMNCLGFMFAFAA